MQEPRDPYLILHVQPTAPSEVVEAAYRALAMLIHPDRSGSESGDEMANLNWAYQTLRDPLKRAEYDQSRVAIPIQSRTSLIERMRERAEALERAAGSPAQVVLDFGRYAGMSIGQLARTDPNYLEWLRRQTAGLRYRHQIDEVLAAAARA